MSKFIPGSTGNVYTDTDGNECGLYTMVTREPSWAASRIREGEKAIAKVAELEAAIKEFFLKETGKKSRRDTGLKSSLKHIQGILGDE